ncbi:MAG: hypothetical protein J6Q17_03740 [Clostridia bacterium]|nr:hypothetical protein [Clostridia bacterium]
MGRTKRKKRSAETDRSIERRTRHMSLTVNGTAGALPAKGRYPGVCCALVDLGEQDVPLPRNAHTDPSYMECLVAHEYGLYTEPAKRARESKDAAGTYRHWSLSNGAGDPNAAH